MKKKLQKINSSNSNEYSGCWSPKQPKGRIALLVSNFIETKYFYITNSAQLLSPFPSKPYVMIANGKHFKFIYTRKAHCQKHFFRSKLTTRTRTKKNSNVNVHIFLT